MLTGSQIRMALAALKWSRSDLAERSGISLRSIERIANMEGVPNMTVRNLSAIQAELEAAGVRFVPDGVVYRAVE